MLTFEKRQVRILKSKDSVVVSGYAFSCPAYAGSHETWPGVASEREFLEGAVSLFQNIVILEFGVVSVVWTRATCDRHDKRLPAARFGSVQFTQCEIECNAMRCAVQRWEGVVKITNSNDDSSVVGCGACCSTVRRSSREWQGQGVKPVAVVAVKLTGSWESRIYNRRAGEADEGFGVGCDWR